MKRRRLSRKAVLGVDAAWTEGGGSGVALVVGEGSAWRVVHVAPGYRQFLERAPGDVDWAARGEGVAPDPARLLARCRELAGGDAPPAVVAVDMPIAPHAPVTGRRAAEGAVARTFGAAGCAVHSPLPHRPGPLGEACSRGFEALGYRVGVAGDAPGGADLLEVYPHPALLALTGAARRLPYKTSRSGQYWPGVGLRERIGLLCDQQARILAGLLRVMDVPPGLYRSPRPQDLTTLAALKPYEDALDALVCAWVGAEFLLGRALAYGDRQGAIWVPAGAGRVEPL